jgi:hypothetical protein
MGVWHTGTSAIRRGSALRVGLAVAITLGLRSAAGATDLVSINIHGASGDAASSGVALNADGTIVAFYSDATDLVTSDTNQVRDVFVRDRSRSATERVSVNSDDVQANGPSHGAGSSPAISGTGDIVAFYSDATNLVQDDTNGHTDVFVRLRAEGSTERVSLSSTGEQSNGDSLNPSISSTGRFVAFQSDASNLVPDDTNGETDIFVRDRENGTTERVCGTIQGNGPSFLPSISADGNFVAFASSATNLVQGDTNNHIDIFVCDRRSGALERVSISSTGEQGNDDSVLPAIDAAGCVVVFKSTASNLVPDDINGVVDVFARDRSTGTTERISVSFTGGNANDESFPPSISYDGRFVAFGSAASNLVRSDVNLLPSVFVRDRLISQTFIVDLNDAGQQANGAAVDVPTSISGDATQIGYVSFASNLTDNDANRSADVFVSRNPTSPSEGGPIAGMLCCQCGEGSCVLPTNGVCPTDCSPVCNAVCTMTGDCESFTPGPSPSASPTGSPPAVTPTPSLSVTPSPAPSTASPTASRSASAIATLSRTPTPTQAGGTSTPTRSATGTATATGSATATGGTTATGSATVTRTATANATATSTAGATGSATASETPTATGTFVSTATATLAASATATAMTTATTTAMATATATPIPSSTATSMPPASTATATAMATATETPVVTVTATSGEMATATRTATATSSATATATGGTATPTATAATATPGRNKDNDTFSCAMAPHSRASSALVWLPVGVVALLAGRRRCRDYSK